MLQRDHLEAPRYPPWEHCPCLRPVLVLTQTLPPVCLLAEDSAPNRNSVRCDLAGLDLAVPRLLPGPQPQIFSPRSLPRSHCMEYSELAKYVEPKSTLAPEPRRLTISISHRAFYRVLDLA